MATRWIDAAALADVPDGDAVAIAVDFGAGAGARQLALFRVGDDVFATDAMCTHGNAQLCGGFLEGHEIECPLHQGRFDIRTGRATCAPAVDTLRTYPVKVDAGRVWLALTSTGHGGEPAGIT